VVSPKSINREKVKAYPSGVDRMIYSSITSKVHLLRTAEHEDEHTQLDFGSGVNRNSFFGDDALKVSENLNCTASVPAFSLIKLSLRQIWSIRFSADQKEIVAGAGSGQIMVYDIENRKRVLCVNAHQEDGEQRLQTDKNGHMAETVDFSTQSTVSASLMRALPMSSCLLRMMAT
jgi:WD40 repeat protein